MQALNYNSQSVSRLSTRYEVTGSPPVLDGAPYCRLAELDVTLVAFRSSGSESLSERWMMVGRHEFSIAIIQSKNNSSNIGKSINSCFQISHDSYMPQLQKEQYWRVRHTFCPELQRKEWIYYTWLKMEQLRLTLYLGISTKMTLGSF